MIRNTRCQSVRVVAYHVILKCLKRWISFFHNFQNFKNYERKNEKKTKTELKIRNDCGRSGNLIKLLFFKNLITTYFSNHCLPKKAS